MNRPMERRTLLPLVVALTLALVVVAGYKLAPFLFPPVDVQVAPEAGCDVQRARCPAEFPGGKVELAFDPQPVPLARPFQVSLDTFGIDPGRVEVDFAGVDMDMGFNRAVLKPAGGGRYRAQVTLPVCISGKMKWRATVSVHTRDRRLSIPFEFFTGEPR